VAIIIIKADDNEVICDICNNEITDADVGGCFIGSYSLCPACANHALQEANPEEKAMIQIVPGPFKKAVLKKRLADRLL